ncbi:MAG: MafI family immunity protein [Defluviitaleaceae bacterium]|nr:MafI family immunity protein [Defluviitaleaceae bacterium]
MTDYQLLGQLISSTIVLISKDLALIPHDKKEICVFIEHNEWGLAFEQLCAALWQDRIAVSQEKYDAIKAMGEIMELESDLWSKIIVE